MTPPASPPAPPGGVAADWGAVRGPRDVDAVLRVVFGAPPSHAPGVLHVAAVAEDPEGGRVVMRIEGATPQSLLDRFLLLAARAHAEAVVTTGRTLREEPRLAHAVRGHPAAEALEAWRREAAGLSGRPRVLVLTASGDVDPDHPALAPPARPVVFTSEEGAARLGPRLRGRPIEVRADPAPDARRAVQWLQEAGRATRITVEAGPTAAEALYAPPPRVDELWLSTYLGPLPPGVRGPAFVPAERLAAALPDVSAPFHLEEPDGPWRFERRRAGRR